jgi:hypothetical protein
VRLRDTWLAMARTVNDPDLVKMTDAFEVHKRRTAADRLAEARGLRQVFLDRAHALKAMGLEE